MMLSTEGRRLIQNFEGLSLKAYRDAGGWSIGYGHYLGEDSSHAGRSITQAEADALFTADVRKYENAVNTYAPGGAQHEFDAMVSLAYNIGTGSPGKGGFADSTVAREHRAGNRARAAQAFALWNKSQGSVAPVLVQRRAREANVYATGNYGRLSAPRIAVEPPRTLHPVALVLALGAAAWWLLPRLGIGRRLLRA